MANDSEERGEVQSQEEQTVGFWDEQLNNVRKEVFVKWGLTS